mmetsp:Transcript_10416/g.31312  ORF Transcript_10416/g.31312 Transcript_10416/m.31312 type:complete len:87 (-) Transcript_10416:263-523(-)
MPLMLRRVRPLHMLPMLAPLQSQIRGRAAGVLLCHLTGLPHRCMCDNDAPADMHACVSAVATRPASKGGRSDSADIDGDVAVRVRL